jgi:hypothetical protein
MRLTWTFFHVFRLLWVGTNIAILAVTAFSWRDLSGLTFMLSFPASVVAVLISVIAFDAAGWSATTLVTVLTGVGAVVSGYVQWFVIGRALAHRILARCPVPRLRGVLEAGALSASVVLGAIGLEMVQAEEQAGDFFDRAMAVHEGMSGKQVQSILGDPKQVFDRTTPDTFSLCSADAVRVASYWYEHEWLPSPLVRGNFFLVLCLDSQGRVLQATFGHV